MIINGQGPSAPDGTGGKATVTSTGTPSKDFTVLRGLALHSRTPFVCVVQAIGAAVLVKTLVMAALAGGAKSAGVQNTATVAA
jgi:hypothetical protein